MTAQDKYQAALSAIRHAVRDRRIAPGDPLVVEDLAKRLRISPTPVREALACLAGMGLTERHGRGYRARGLEPNVIAELYELHLAYVRLAIRRPRPAGPWTTGTMSDVAAGVSAQAGRAYRDRIEGFWSATVGDDRPRLLAALAQVADQLALVRLVEPSVFLDAETEFESLNQKALTDVGAFEAAAISYHDRRREAANLLSAEAHWSLKGVQI